MVKKKKSNIKKFTTVKSRHLSDKYTDPDVVLAYSMFEILTRFLETESKNVDWSYNTISSKSMHEMNHLAFWFNHIYVPFTNSKHDNNPYPSPEKYLVPVIEDGHEYWELNKKGHEDFWEYVEMIGDMEDNMSKRLMWS